MKELVIIDAVDAAGNRIREDNPVVCTDCVALPLISSLGGKDLQESARINIIDSADDDAECEHCGWSKPFTPITDSYTLVRDRLHSLRKELAKVHARPDAHKELALIADILGQCTGLEYALGILQDMSIRSEKIAAAKVWEELDKVGAADLTRDQAVEKVAAAEVAVEPEDKAAFKALTVAELDQ